MRFYYALLGTRRAPSRGEYNLLGNPPRYELANLRSGSVVKLRKEEKSRSDRKTGRFRGTNVVKSKGLDSEKIESPIMLVSSGLGTLEEKIERARLTHCQSLEYLTLLTT